MKPIIGITTGSINNSFGQRMVTLNEAYIKAILQAGGVPLLIPSASAANGNGESEEFGNIVDGILFTGGGDISPDRFQGDPHPRIDDVDEIRDSVELNLLQTAVGNGTPFLGICRGCQLMNVGLGGTLYTHIPDQLPGALDHAYPGNMRKVLVHKVKIEEGTRTGQLLGEPIVSVNSHHHQGLKGIAPSLQVTGNAPDGLVEAIELKGHPFGIGVQWHPEWLTDQEVTRNLFSKFINAAVSPSR